MYLPIEMQSGMATAFAHLCGLVLHSPADLVEERLHEWRSDLRRRVHQALIYQQPRARVEQRLRSNANVLLK